MNERDELAELIWEDAAADRVKDGTRASLVPVVRSKVEAMADKILAAGYRKPRTITTAEELDALPVGSVVLRSGRAFQRFVPHPAPFDEYRMWKCTDGGFVRSTKDGSSILPATVLHEGTQP